MTVGPATGLVWHELYLWFDTMASAGPLDGSQPWIEPGYSGEGPESRRRLKSLVEASGLAEAFVPITPQLVEQADLLSVHAREYVDLVDSVSRGGGGLVGPNVPIGARGFEIARLAAGGAVAAVDAVAGSQVRRAYALVRPPGHHATRESGFGNCVFNNVAIAAVRARRHWGVGRVAIVDWDVHHGNGTEAIFLDDPDVLTISLHQDDWYPRYSGAVGVRGQGRAAGANINVPLPAGSGSDAYLAAIREIVHPALVRHRPELILVACGYDGNAMDPYGRMLLNSRSFASMTEEMMAAADSLCDGRLVMCHEGGYSPLYVPFCGLAVLEQLSGQQSGVIDPYLERYEGEFQRLRPEQRLAIDRARPSAP